MCWIDSIYRILEIKILYRIVSNLYWQYTALDHTGWSHPPLNRKCPNISKTFEISTSKPYIFLFLVSSNRWWCEVSNTPLDTGSAQISWKLLRSPCTFKPCILLCHVASDGMEVKTIRSGPVPFDTRNDQIYSCFLCQVTDDGVKLNKHPLDTGSAQISWKPLKSPPYIYSCFMCQVASDGMQMMTVHRDRH
jgi:hypothetical protein